MASDTDIHRSDVLKQKDVSPYKFRVSGPEATGERGTGRKAGDGLF